MPPKRAATAADNAAAPKRARTSDAHAAAKALLKSILDAPESFELPENDDEIIANFELLARYTKHLEEQLSTASAAPASAAATVQKTPEQLADAAEKIRKAAVAGIKKQMTVRLFTCAVPHFCRAYDISVSSGSHRARRTAQGGPTTASAPTRRSSDTSSDSAVRQSGR